MTEKKYLNVTFTDFLKNIQKIFPSILLFCSVNQKRTLRKPFIKKAKKKKC